ncbi:MAG: UPF0280 family protein [Caldimicrobium sp.]
MKYAGIPFYRTQVKSSLKSFRVVYKQTDLLVLADNELVKETLSLVIEIRKPLEMYILKNPLFLKSLEPLPDDGEAPEIVRKMLYAGRIAGVGPMASVAGAIAEAVGKALLEKNLTQEIVVENGGDIFLNLKKEARVLIFAGDSYFSGKLALIIPKEVQPCGVCTSSGKIGHSLSFGKADAITVVHKDTAVADALATKFGNMLREGKDFKKIISLAERIDNIYGIFAVVKDKFFTYTKKIFIEPVYSSY